jgi:hypothetical protein
VKSRIPGALAVASALVTAAIAPAAAGDRLEWTGKNLSLTTAWADLGRIAGKAVAARRLRFIVAGILSLSRLT